jgi:hypothetical protein
MHEVVYGLIIWSWLKNESKRVSWYVRPGKHVRARWARMWDECSNWQFQNKLLQLNPYFNKITLKAYVERKACIAIRAIENNLVKMIICMRLSSTHIVTHIKFLFGRQR